MELARQQQDGGTPAQQLEIQKGTVTQYEGAVDSDVAALATAKINLGYTRIVSPITGRAGLRQVDPGNRVSPSDASGIVVITELAPISVIFTALEDDARPIAERLTAGATLPVAAYDRNNVNKLAEGTLLALDNQIDVPTGTVKLRAIFDNKDGALFPNQFVNIQLTLDTLHGQILIPTTAVHRMSGTVPGDYVYLVNRQDSTVSLRPVHLGISDGARIAVTQGVSAGDMVVTGGGDRLRDGAQVLLPR
jgi:multidrug efflux system membrane fusion protein